MRNKVIFLIMLLSGCVVRMEGQTALVNTGNSNFARMSGVGMGDVQWTNGFWAERFAVCKNASVPELWNIYTSDTICYAFENFKIAAGLEKGVFRGPSFHDGDFYKTIEAMAAMYASTNSAKLMKEMDEAIAVIGKAQRPDGYVYTKNIIEQNNTGKEKMFDDKLSFEAYNFGHLMTSASVHYRATGKRNLLNIAIKAADFLVHFYNTATPEQARNAICPSHYMGLAEIYRTTGQKKYIDLLKYLVDIRGTGQGTDDNSDRAPFREMRRVVGHAVRANYLFAGVADLYAEDGDITLMHTLGTLWNNVIHTKMYVTGASGALYDGVSVDGTSYNPDTVQKVHQAYGRDYQLPNFTAHNESCANIGNVLWNYRMFLITGEEKYFDVVELALYNSVLSGISMDGTKFFYTNPLAHTLHYPYHLRWEGGRVPYISLSNCCPPNLVRTIAEVNNYMYSLSNDGLYLNMYGGNNLETKLRNGNRISLSQLSDYPWDGAVLVTINDAPEEAFAIHLRIPGWCKKATVKVNGKIVEENSKGGIYVTLNRKWKKNDRVELQLNMPAVLLESNPTAEETRNQVAVKRGPVVYCLEGADLKNQNIFDISIPLNIDLKPVSEKLAGGNVVVLEGKAWLIHDENWKNTLYREVSRSRQQTHIKLIPYYSWANRGNYDMTVWMPLSR